MSRVLTNNQYYSQIANVIREQNGTSNTYKPAQMVRALKDLFYEEVEGVPPINFQGIGENLLDYRIDGASGGVGDRTGNLFDGSWENKFVDTYGNTGYSTNRVLSSYVTVIPNQTYSVKSNMRIRAVHSYNDTTHTQTLIDSVSGLDGATFTIPADSNSIRISLKKANDGVFTPDDIDWFMLNAGSTALPYEPYGYKVPVVVNGKNLFNKNDVIEGSLNPYDGKTIIYNNQLHTKNYIPVTANDVYIISGLDYGIRVHEYNSNHNFIKSYVVNNNNSFTVSNNCAYIRVAGSINQFLDTGMINLGSTSLPYEPYIEPTTTNIYIDEPIKENESITLSDTNTNIPTIRGTNVLTVDTTVQPSNVYVKARKESQYETIMRERYEEAQAQLDALESE